ncbi:MAG: HD domain-containing protein [Vallitalea sp.]|jgi:HD-GYP domain-containing protein (c-di-GMP phosphodiesterase class II)|nr:HD domain-containing protein [Vallitalea sp.]
MKINLNKLLLSLSYTLDFVEMDVLGVTSNHSKRVAYIACRLGKYLGMNENELFDLVTCTILHDNGVNKYMLDLAAKANTSRRKLILENAEEHCIIGEDNIINYPFLTDVTNVIKYHHETYNGKGFFNLKGDDIPLMSQLIYFGDIIDNKFNLKEIDYDKINRINDFVDKQENKLFSPKIVEAFRDVSGKSNFWLDIDDHFIYYAIRDSIPEIEENINWNKLEEITKIFSSIIDNKSEFTMKHSSGLANKLEKMGKFYNKDNIEITKLRIAANLHDVGKLAINNEIIDKPSKLTDEEFYIVKQHTYLSRISLQHIEGFEDITEWACNHHERLDGTGYPYGKKGDELDFNSRLVACLDIYQALMEERPYRKGLSHNKSIEILKNMGQKGWIDNNIVEDIDKVFMKID